MLKDDVPTYKVRARTHLLTVLPVLILYLFGFVYLLVAAMRQMLRPGSGDPLIETMRNVAAIVVGAAFILTWVDWRLRIVIVTPHQVTVRWGWLGWHQRVVQMQSATVHLDQSLWERMVDMGTVVIMPVNGEEMRLPHLGDFSAIRRAFA